MGVQYYCGGISKQARQFHGPHMLSSIASCYMVMDSINVFRYKSLFNLKKNYIRESTFLLVDKEKTCSHLATEYNHMYVHWP